jgi:hypothetical protein
MSIGQAFGQKEDLTIRIRQILRGYDTQAHIFTEMIQNADDAGASEIRFIIDFRQLPAENVFTHEGYHSLLGPALCSWSDSIFTETDYEGIASIGKPTQSPQGLHLTCLLSSQILKAKGARELAGSRQVDSEWASTLSFTSLTRFSS